MHQESSPPLNAPAHEAASETIDCPPNLGLLTLNALTAAELVIVPTQTEYLAMRSIKELMNIIDKVREHTNPDLDLRLLCTMFDRRTIHGKYQPYFCEIG